MTASYRLIIVGGGIVGAAFAYAAARRGVGPILMIDSGAPHPTPDSATTRSWAWVNAATDHDQEYFRLRHASMDKWTDWIADVPALAKSSTGGFLWDLSGTALQEYVKTHAEWGYPVSLLSGDQLAARLPFLREIPDAAAFCPAEFALEPTVTARALVAASGAQIMTARVDALVHAGGRVTGVRCGETVISGTDVIVTAGQGSAALMDSVDCTLALAPTMGLLVTSTPVPAFLPYLITAPDYHIRQLPDGALLIGGRFNADLAPTDGAATTADSAATALLARVGAAIDLPAPLEMDHYTVGQRVIPADGRPVVGRMTTRAGTPVTGLYVAVMHSGVSNAAGVAHHAIDDIVGGDCSAILQPFRPGRA